MLYSAEIVIKTNAKCLTHKCYLCEFSPRMRTITNKARIVDTFSSDWLRIKLQKHTLD